MKAKDIKTLIYTRYNLYPIFVFEELDDHGNSETITIDSMKLESPRDDFLINYTADIFLAAMANEEEIQVPERNSFLDTAFAVEELAPDPHMDHADRLRVEMLITIDFAPITCDEDMDHDY